MEAEATALRVQQQAVRKSWRAWPEENTNGRAAKLESAPNGPAANRVPSGAWERG